MDSIKETYNILLYHLGEDTPRGRKLPERHNQLNKDLTKLVSYSLGVGHAAERMEVNKRFCDDTRQLGIQLDIELRQMQSDLRQCRPESRDTSNVDEQGK